MYHFNTSLDNFLFSDCLQNSFGGGGASLAWSTKFRSETDLVFRKGSGAEWVLLNNCSSLRASSPIWASEASLARTRERAAKPRGAEERSRFLGPLLARSREARFPLPNRRPCSQATTVVFWFMDRYYYCQTQKTVNTWNFQESWLCTGQSI